MRSRKSIIFKWDHRHKKITPFQSHKQRYTSNSKLKEKTQHIKILVQDKNHIQQVQVQVIFHKKKLQNTRQKYVKPSASNYQQQTKKK